LRDVAKTTGLGDNGRLCKIRVMLHESHVARGWYEADI
jgi:hypothetical protein